MTSVRRGRTHAAPPRRLLAVLAVLAVLASAVALSACSRQPPTIVPPAPTVAQLPRLQRVITGLLADPQLSHGTWGVVVKSMARNDTLFALNERKLLMPASTMKVVTLATAADRLGWDFAYRTRLSMIGSLDAGVLNGDVLIEGSGDPTLDDWSGTASGVFDRWAESLEQAGVHSITGRVIGDDNAFDDEGLGAGWAWDDLGASYATSVGALQFNENTAQIVVRPGEAVDTPAIVEVNPGVATLSIRNLATTGAVGSPATVSVRPIARSLSLEVRGTIPGGSPAIVRNVSVPNPTLYFANAVRSGLVRHGIEILGPAVDVDDVVEPLDRARANAIAETSTPVSAFVGTMMNLSQNLFAETLLRTLGLHDGGIGSAEAGRDVVRSTLTGWGVPASDILMVDGSGLSRYNLVTPDALVTVLMHVYQDPRLREPFMSALPRVGLDGTLEERMKGTAAAGKARAKTGSFSNARAIAGYVTTAGGEPLAFAILANNYGVEARAVEHASDAIIVALAEFSRR